MSNFFVRLATFDDYDLIMDIYADAREFMKVNGNESQWGLPSPGKSLWPSEDSVKSKISTGIQYICETKIDDKQKIAATFAFTNGIDEPSYNSIYEGSWPDDGNEPYGVIHCFASANVVKGAGSFCLDWALNQCKYMKIDTHPNNKPMRSLLEKNNFVYCGKILMPEVQNDDIIRVAYCKRIN